MNKNSFTYKKSGVNIEAADKFINFISKITSKNGNKKFNNISQSIPNLPNKIKKPKIVARKMELVLKSKTNTLKKYDTIGIDLVAMSVNDLIVQGAKSLF